MLSIALRKIGSFYNRYKLWLNTKTISTACAVFMEGISVGKYVSFEKGVEIKATDGGSIKIGDEVFLGRNVKILARGGRIVVGNGVFIGDGCLVVSLDCITIDSDTQIAEYVVIRDQDHRFTSRPIKNAGFETSPIVVGKDVWIGCKTTVLKGTYIGDGAVIAAHSLVRGEVPPFTLAAGTPAQVKKQLS